MSYGESGSSTRSTAFPRFSRPLFSEKVLPFAQQLLASYDPTGGGLRRAANAQYESTLSGQYLNPAANPTLAPSVGAITSAAKDYLDTALKGGADRLQGAGMGLSNKAAQAFGNIARRSTQDVTNRVADLYSQNYNNERALQANAAPQATAASELDLNQLLQFLQLLKGSESKGSSYSQQGSLF